MVSTQSFRHNAPILLMFKTRCKTFYVAKVEWENLCYTDEETLVENEMCDSHKYQLWRRFGTKPKTDLQLNKRQVAGDKWMKYIVQVTEIYYTSDKWLKGIVQVKKDKLQVNELQVDNSWPR